jgi:AcrR family transcriptional regulator
MSVSAQRPAQPRRGRAAKHAAIMGAARLAFGRDGYPRTSIDSIATEAGVSTRTIYNHFEGKEQLFNAVLLNSAGQVADGFAAALASNLAELPAQPDAHAVLEVVGRALVAHRADNPEHFAMVRQIDTEAGHFPASALAGWREAGPLRVRGEVADQLSRLADRGLLRIEDSVRAALHFTALVHIEVDGESWREPAPAVGTCSAAEAVAAAVRAFLYGYLARP